MSLSTAFSVLAYCGMKAKTTGVLPTQKPDFCDVQQESAGYSTVVLLWLPGHFETDWILVSATPFWWSRITLDNHSVVPP